MNCGECAYVERRGAYLYCQIKLLPIYRIQECNSFKPYNEEEEL